MEIFHAEGFLYREKCGKRTVEIREKGEESAVCRREEGKGKKKSRLTAEKNGEMALEKRRGERKNSEK